MNREEVLKAAKPILFNTEMVKALLDGRKTVTRRVVKHGNRNPISDGRPIFYELHDNADTKIAGPADKLYAGFYNKNDVWHYKGVKHVNAIYYKSNYKTGDILYVKEAWYADIERIMYRANYSDGKEIKMKWRPSLFMPKEAARIFLKVTDVRVEQLQEITHVGTIREGAKNHDYDGWCGRFKTLWDSTIKKTDIGKYDFDSNPFVWVIEFERIEVK